LHSVAFNVQLGHPTEFKNVLIELLCIFEIVFEEIIFLRVKVKRVDKEVAVCV
jgi:hypothetical protein